MQYEDAFVPKAFYLSASDLTKLPGSPLPFLNRHSALTSLNLMTNGPLYDMIIDHTFGDKICDHDDFFDP